MIKNEKNEIIIDLESYDAEKRWLEEHQATTVDNDLTVIIEGQPTVVTWEA